MKQLWITLPALAPDYSGVCSAVFDLGGITVIHDASGCTGNYAGYDEPRWFGSSAKIFSSGLRDIDAVLGRDDRLIDNMIQAGKELNPTIYTIAGSPVPMVIGSDMKGIARELEQRTGIPSFGFDVNGLGLYNRGVSQTICALIKRFTEPQEEKIEKGINILGTNAVDLANNGNDQDIVNCLESWGFTVIGRMTMGATIKQIQELAKARVNLVVSESGLDAAKMLQKQYGMPYVAGMPLGQKEIVHHVLNKTLQDKQNRVICDESEEGGILIIGEQVLSNSIRSSILQENPNAKVTVGTMFGLNRELAGKGDIDVVSEELLIELLDSGKYRILVGDPLMEELIGEESSMEIRRLPHIALSSKLYWNQAPRYLSDDFGKFIKELA